MSNNVYIRSLYAPGYAYVTFSFFKTNLSVSFAPWLSRDEIGRSQYDTKNFLSTTVSDESVASLYFLSRSIIEGKQSSPLQYVIDCNKNTRLIFEYGPDQNNQIRAHLVIEKNNATIQFPFAVHQCQVRENGKLVTKTIQAGLIVFVEVLETYLTAVGADRQQNQQTGIEFGGSQMQGYSSVWA